MLRVMFLRYCRIGLVCLALELVGSWVELGFSVGMETFGGLRVLALLLQECQHFSIHTVQKIKPLG